MSSKSCRVNESRRLDRLDFEVSYFLAKWLVVRHEKVNKELRIL